jgi:pyruvate formate lyase activating enzyme
MKVEARHYRKADDGVVQCLLCPHNCTIREGKSGICGVRTNEKGTLVSAIYGELTAMAMDPIEKKPLYHFHPGSQILSIGTKGCNFKCSYCQNWNISQDANARSSEYSPEQVVAAAEKNDSVGIAYTYSEPMIWFEFVMDCAKIARTRGLKNVLVTNGFVNPAPLDELLEFTDAMNIDLKNFREESHRKVQKGRLSDVLRTIEAAHGRCHVELTTLIVTGINDTMEEMNDIINWIAALDGDIPWHVSRYYPSFRYDAPATDVEFLLEVCDRAKERLHHVYCGNISGSYGRSDTACPRCGTVAVKRSGYHIRVTGLEHGRCAKCGHDLKIPQ